MSGMNLTVGIPGLKQGTNINDLEVPEALRHRRLTGLSFFDDALGGEGFVPSSVMMLSGTPGAGKSTMMLQLANSLTSQGHIALFNSGEESLYQVKMVAERLRLKNGFVVGQDVMVEDLLNHADHLRAANPGKQVFILQDSIQTLDDGKYTGGTNTMTPVRCTEMLTNWAKSANGIVCFIGQVTKAGDFAGKQTILHAVDIRAHLYIDEVKKSETYGERIFTMTKNRFGCSGKSYILGLNKTGLYERGTFTV